MGIKVGKAVGRGVGLKDGATVIVGALDGARSNDAPLVQNQILLSSADPKISLDWGQSSSDHDTWLSSVTGSSASSTCRVIV